jgi:hypothetical protein
VDTLKALRDELDGRGPSVIVPALDAAIAALSGGEADNVWLRRWYCVSKTMGTAMLCKDRADAEKEARAADSGWPNAAPHYAVQLAPLTTPRIPDGCVVIERDYIENADAALAISTADVGGKWTEYESPRWELRSALGLPCEKSAAPGDKGTRVTPGGTVVIDPEAAIRGLQRSGVLGRAREHMRFAGEEVGTPTRQVAEDTLCVKCGQPTMHVGNVCYACSHSATPPASSQGDR